LDKGATSRASTLSAISSPLSPRFSLLGVNRFRASAALRLDPLRALAALRLDPFRALAALRLDPLRALAALRLDPLRAGLFFVVLLLAFLAIARPTDFAPNRDSS
jgi:hypothetical protein